MFYIAQNKTSLTLSKEIQSICKKMANIQLIICTSAKIIMNTIYNLLMNKSSIYSIINCNAILIKNYYLFLLRKIPLIVKFLNVYVFSWYYLHILKRHIHDYVKAVSFLSSSRKSSSKFGVLHKTFLILHDRLFSGARINFFFLFSESSMFVSSRRWILKTCGTTTPLQCLRAMMELAAEVAGHTQVDNVFYSRKNFMRPHLQQNPHRDFEQEVRHSFEPYLPQISNDATWHVSMQWMAAEIKFLCSWFFHTWYSTQVLNLKFVPN